MTHQGVARPLWLRMEHERLRRRWSKSQLAQETGLPRSTLDRLETSSRPPQPRIVSTIAETLDIDAGEAFQLAGLVPPQADEGSDVREAIRGSLAYTDEQKALLLQMVDVLDAANKSDKPEGGQRTGQARLTAI